MSTEITFPLALCKAQWSIWLHTQALALAPLHAFWSGVAAGQQRERASCVRPVSAPAQAHAADAPASRGDVVHNALCTLHTALAAARTKT